MPEGSIQVNQPRNKKSDGPPRIQPGLYSANVLLPLPGIGQLIDWNPGGTALLVTVVLRLVGWLRQMSAVSWGTLWDTITASGYWRYRLVSCHARSHAS
jgi:hypothetical protein